MKAVLTYLFADHHRRLPATARTLLGLAAVLAVLVYMGELWPAVNYLQTEAAEQASWEVRVNGPLEEADVVRIAAAAREAGARWTGANVMESGGSILEGGTGRDVGASITYYAAADASETTRTPFSEGMLALGRMWGADAIGVDTLTARRLDLRLGQRLEIRQSLVDSDGAARTAKTEGVVRALFHSAEGVRGLLAPESRELAAMLAEVTEGVRFSDIFIDSPRGSAPVLAALGESGVSDNWLVETREAARARARAAARDGVGHEFRTTGVWVALAVFAVYALRDQLTRAERRRKPYAVLYALGVRRSEIAAALAAEQAAMMLLVGVAGYAGGSLVLQRSLGAIIPPAEAVQLVLTLTGALAAVTLLSVGLAWDRLRRLPVVRLLSVE